MRNFLFTDNETGEDFIVEARTSTEAFDIARTYFEQPKCIDIITDEEAEMLGYDTY